MAASEHLFPETLSQAVNPDQECTWLGSTLNRWDEPVATVKLLPVWFDDRGWMCGWLIHIATALDEWHPLNPNAWKQHSTYPWHRPDTMPQSGNKVLAMAMAARECRIVIAQMLVYIPPELHAEVSEISDAIEVQARTWLLS